MKKRNPMHGFITKVIFIAAVLQSFFNKEEQAETAEELLVISGSITQIGIGLVLTTSLITHAVFSISMFLSVPLWCCILPLLYHLGRVMYVQKKSLL